MARSQYNEFFKIECKANDKECNNDPFAGIEAEVGHLEVLENLRIKNNKSSSSGIGWTLKQPANHNFELQKIHCYKGVHH